MVSTTICLFYVVSVLYLDVSSGFWCESFTIGSRSAPSDSVCSKTKCPKPGSPSDIRRCRVTEQLFTHLSQFHVDQIRQFSLCLFNVYNV